MKKTLICLLVFLLVISNLMTVSAEENNESNSTIISCNLPVSHEKPLPQYANNEIQKSNLAVEKMKSERDEWKKATKDELERAYSQKISSIYENDNYIIFEFYPKESVKKDEYSVNDKGIISVEYLKLEGEIGEKLINAKSTTSLDTKIITYYGWSNGYENYVKKTKNLIDFVGFAIGFVPTLSKVASALQILAFGNSLYQSLDDSTPITTQTLYQSYYQNKVGSVYFANTWNNTVYVGSRRCFGCSWSCILYDSGMASNPYWTSKKTPNSQSNPTNYDGSIEKKTHFDDNNWIIQKALEQWNAHAIYKDVYKMVNLS